ncbi:MAG: ABC transporter substrate-binding protein [Candidatus Handelsmanbacteria bacterium]|nr:ABC transporter substrate-binding protein [Candidatus Handelsmanbacteria bacterium]
MRPRNFALHLLACYLGLALHLVAWAESAPNSPAAEKLYGKGLRHYTRGEWGKARDAFVDLVKQPPNHRSAGGQLLLGRALYHLGEYERGLQVAQRLEQKFPDSPLIPDACLVGGDCGFALQRYAEGALLYGRVLAHPQAALPLKGQAAERLAGMSGNGLLSSQSWQRLEALVGGGVLREGLAYGALRWYQRLGWEPQSRAAARAYRRQYPGGIFLPLLAEAVPAPARTKVVAQVAPTAPPLPPARPPEATPRLGLLLPLSGPDNRLGRELLEGARLANREQGAPFQLVPLDTGFDYGNLPIAEDQEGELVRTGLAIRALIADERVLAAVGPVFSGPAAVAAVGAEAGGLPLLVPLAQQSGLDSLGGHTFQLRSPPEAQGRALGEYAALGLGLRTLVVLAPLTSYGWNFEREFTRAAQAQGSRVIHRDWYLPDLQKDFRREFAEIRRVGLALKPPPPDSLAGLALPDTAAEGKEEVVGTIDGVVVVVESFEDAKTIAAQLHFHQLRTQLLGNDLWHAPESLAELSEDERRDFLGCMFVTNRDESSPAARQFAEGFHRQTGQRPEYAASAYDAARLVIAGWQEGRRDREALRGWLSGVQGFAGASGRISFGRGQQANGELMMMKVSRRGQIVPASQPEEAEAPPAVPSGEGEDKH